MPKTCRGFYSKKNGAPHIICNIARFEDTSDADQYRLIHHEFAGLVSVEKNVGAASDYEISNQITDQLEEYRSVRLPVKGRNLLNCHVEIKSIKEADENKADAYKLYKDLGYKNEKFKLSKSNYFEKSLLKVGDLEVKIFIGEVLYDLYIYNKGKMLGRTQVMKDHERSELDSFLYEKGVNTRIHVDCTEAY